MAECKTKQTTAENQRDSVRDFCLPEQGYAYLRTEAAEWFSARFYDELLFNLQNIVSAQNTLLSFKSDVTWLIYCHDDVDPNSDTCKRILDGLDRLDVLLGRAERKLNDQLCGLALSFAQKYHEERDKRAKIQKQDS